MHSRFTWDPDGTPSANAYLTDDVRVEAMLDADAYDYLDGSTQTDVRRVRLAIEMTMVWEQISGATPRTAGEIWLALIKGESLRVYPDATDLTTYLNVVPDLSHAPTLLAVRRGTVERGQTLRLLSKTWFDPADVMLERFAALIPTL